MNLISENIKIFGNFTNLDEVKQLKEFENVAEMLEHTFKTNKNRVAIVDNGVNYTYEHININTGFIRSKLNALGIKKGDHVGVLYSNSIEFVESSLAIMSLGCVAVVLPYHLDDKTLQSL